MRVTQARNFCDLTGVPYPHPSELIRVQVIGSLVAPRCQEAAKMSKLLTRYRGSWGHDILQS